MDNATLTDNNGVKSDFQNVILIMTSNLGATADNVVGFAKDTLANEDKAIKRFFAPEFRNRLDATVKFLPLNEPIMIGIVDKLLGELEEQLKEKDVKIVATLEAKKCLAHKGFDDALGARVMARVISEEIKTPLTDEILFGKLSDGGEVFIDLDEDDKITFEYKAIKELDTETN